MSVKVMAAVWEIVGLSPAEKLVLLKHADHADDDGGNSYPSVAALVRTCGLDERRIQRTRQSLIQKGFLKPITFAAGGRGRATVYRVVVASAAEETVTPVPPFETETVASVPPFAVSADYEKGGISAPKRVAFSTEKGGAGTTPTIKEEPSKKNHHRGAARSRRRPATVLPPEWNNAPIPAELLDIAVSQGLSPEAAQLEFEKLTSYALMHDRRCRAWVQAWRNWLAIGKGFNNGHSNRSGNGTQQSAERRARDNFMAGAARAVNRRGQGGE